MRDAVSVSNDSPVLLDCFLDQAVEVDVDAICDGKDVLIGGIMEHIEQAGVHSGDSACALPPYSLSEPLQEEIRRQMRLMARELGVVGLMNAQFAVRDQDIFVLEVNPRASRTVPFVSKACSLPLAGIAARVMSGKTLQDQGIRKEIVPNFYSVKEAVFPFIKFPGVDPILGPEMRSTGEVMGWDVSFPLAFLKAQLGAGSDLPREGNLGGLRMQTREPVRVPMQIRVTESQMFADSPLVNRIGQLFYLWGTPVVSDAEKLPFSIFDSMPMESPVRFDSSATVMPALARKARTSRPMATSSMFSRSSRTRCGSCCGKPDAMTPPDREDADWV